ncbi:MAG: hypothetical protein ABSD41_09265 [Candidatus Bathyarchaeia archaeon]
MAQERRKNRIKILSYLFAAVVALSLTTAIQFLVRPSNTTLVPFAIPLPNGSLFVAFLVTIIPFYHGATLALTNVSLLRTRRLLHLSNFGMLLIEAMIFYTMALSLSSINGFITWFAILMFADCAWVTFIHIAGGSDDQAPKKWAYVNFGMAVALVLLSIFATDKRIATNLTYLVGLAAVTRTILDYSLTWQYYFD